MAIDLIVHRRNSKGEVVHHNPYRLHVVNGIKVYEQPAGSGHYQYENGQPCTAVGEPVKADAPKVIEPKVEPTKVTVVASVRGK